MEIKHTKQEIVEDNIKICQNIKHVQQVVFSTYHHALTQICFSCGVVRTSMKEGDLNSN